MKFKLTSLAQRYALGWRQYLKPGPPRSRRRALKLGRQAVAPGLETLELARIPGRALVTLGIANGNVGRLGRVEDFFTKANPTIKETQRAAQPRKAHLCRRTETLSRRTKELAVSHRELQREVVSVKVLKDACQKSGRAQKKSLAESLQLQNRLRQPVARRNPKGLKNQIASAQRRVVMSAQAVQRFARKLDLHRPALSGRSRLAI